jgi:hypothetical protein
VCCPSTKATRRKTNFGIYTDHPRGMRLLITAKIRVLPSTQCLSSSSIVFAKFQKAISNAARRSGPTLRGYQIRILKLMFANLHKSTTQTPAPTIPPIRLRPNATDMGSLFIASHHSRGPVTSAPSVPAANCPSPPRNVRNKASAVDSPADTTSPSDPEPSDSMASTACFVSSDG